MDILIITTCFIPDSAIAAVRPYMLAKHLSEAGENVTVLRSGQFEKKPFDEYDQSSMNFEVISALGENCDAEKFRRGEYVPYEHTPKLKYSFLPLPIKVMLRAFRDFIRKLRGKKVPKCLENMVEVLAHQKETISRLKERHFDVVFATFGAIENISAGIFAAETFDAKLIIDYRDSAIRHDEWMDLAWNSYAKKLNTLALKKADCVTAISNALAEELKAYNKSAYVRTVYNGFDDTLLLPNVSPDEGILSFCYTGSLYCNSIPALRILTESIADMIRLGNFERDRIRFHYAGPSAEEFRKPFEQSGIAELLTDHSYLSKKDTHKLQMSSDIFLVLSWNKRNSRGILTGKFYEGIHAEKPILAGVSGNLPDSELMLLQKQYNYGFCYEQACAKECIPELKTYLENIYREKLNNGKLSYRPAAKLYRKFSYTCIADEIHQIMKELVVGFPANTSET